MSTSADSNVLSAFEKVLNRHGYSFQYSVMREVERLYGKSPWTFRVPEFPVEVQGSGTRIDFILAHRFRRMLLLAECKRANPALSSWCFAHVPKELRGEHDLHDAAFVETLELRSGIGQVGHHIITYPPDNVYSIAFDVKNNKDGDPGGQGRGAIEEAATQVCRGLNGLIEVMRTNKDLLRDAVPWEFLPVIFTTARLYITKVDISRADLISGEINLKSGDVIEKPWLFYHYYQSPGIKHAAPLRDGFGEPTFANMLYTQYARTIAIVSATGIEDFLCYHYLQQ